MHVNSDSVFLVTRCQFCRLQKCLAMGMRSDSPRVAAASEARRSSSLSTSGKRVSLEAETAYDSHRSSGISTSGKRASLEAEMAYDSHRSSGLSTSSKRVSLDAEMASDSPTLLPLQSLVFPSNQLSQQDVAKREQKDDSSRYYNNNRGGFYS